MQLLFFNSWVSEETLKAICWTLIHSLWQGLLAAVLAGIIIICTRRSPARLRYNLLGAVLILFSLAAGVTFYSYTESSHAGAVPANVYTEDPSLAFVTTDNVVTVAAGTNAIDTLVNYFNKNADLFVLLWAVFFLVHCIKLLTGFAGVQRLSTYKTHAPAENWQARLNQLGKKLRVQQSVRLLQSELVKIPVAAGIFKPVILVPLGLLSNLPPEQVETILMHELAHIRRKDYLINILQRFTEAIFFFNPALLWISSLLRQEREACCDDIVIAHTHHKGNYLEALVSFQEYSQAGTAYAMAISSKKHYLLNRVKRMLTQENKKLNLMEKILLVAGLAVVTAFTLVPRQKIADNKAMAVITSSNEKEPGTSEPLQYSSEPAISPAAVKKNSKKEMRRTALPVIVRDTVPPKKERTSVDALEFKSMSTTTNDDGKAKTEKVSATDQNGSTYSFTKLNGKITSLTVDNKNIPESEMNMYMPVIEKIEFARKEDAIRRTRDMQLRKDDLAKRREEVKARTVELKKQREEQDKTIQHQQEKKKLFQEEHKKLFDKEMTEQRKEQQKKRMEDQQRRKEDQERRQRKTNIPTINGREVIKNDRKEIENEKSYDVDLRSEVALNKKITLNTEQPLVLQKKPDVVTTQVQKLKYDLMLKNKIDEKKLVELKTNLSKDVNLKYDLKLSAPLKPGTVPKSPPAPCKPEKKKPTVSKEPVVTA